MYPVMVRVSSQLVVKVKFRCRVEKVAVSQPPKVAPQSRGFRNVIRRARFTGENRVVRTAVRAVPTPGRISKKIRLSQAAAIGKRSSTAH